MVLTVSMHYAKLFLVTLIYQSVFLQAE
jgi:hypothetical protein